MHSIITMLYHLSETQYNYEIVDTNHVFIHLRLDALFQPAHSDWNMNLVNITLGSIYTECVSLKLMSMLISCMFIYFYKTLYLFFCFSDYDS